MRQFLQLNPKGIKRMNTNQGHLLRANRGSSRLGLPVARFNVLLILSTG
jgi:hypothetical protein